MVSILLHLSGGIVVVIAVAVVAVDGVFLLHFFIRTVDAAILVVTAFQSLSVVWQRCIHLRDRPTPSRVLMVVSLPTTTVDIPEPN